MKTLKLLWIVGTLVGCASQDEIRVPDWNIPQATETATQPIELPDLPEFSAESGSVVLSRQDVLMLLAYREAAESNFETAQGNAAALVVQSESYNNLIRSGQLLVEVMTIREDVARRDRANAFADRMFYRGLLVLLGIAGAAQ